MTLTDFGFKKIPVEEKNKKVGGVFSSVASKYDLMNDLMSMGIHRLWKRAAIECLDIRSHHTVLDIAGGTGDLSRLIYPKLKKTGQLWLVDINPDMLRVGRDRLLDEGLCHIHPALGNAENLPFNDNVADRVIIGFGLRNVTHKDRALKEFYRVLKPGGKVLVLEFSKPLLPWLAAVYDQYSFQVLPALGEWVANDAESYQYLAESIRVHPDQSTLKQMMQEAGLEGCEFYNLTGGIVALHEGFKY